MSENSGTSSPGKSSEASTGVTEPLTNDGPVTSAIGSFLHSHRNEFYSTAASVDSESDYQLGVNSSSGAVATPSVLSRSSSFSMLSTTAQKDGIQGRRIRRFHDPIGYAQWETDLVEDQGDMTTVVSELSPLSTADEATPPQTTTLDYGEDVSNTHYFDRETNGRMNFQSNELISWNQDYREPGIANDPTAPPVTLREKIRLLRTGSVSGDPKHSEGHSMMDPYSTSDRSNDDDFDSIRISAEVASLGSR